MSCITSIAVSVLVNGSPTKQVILRCGLRQGCSLSLFLFNMVTKAFSTLINKAIALWMCKEVEVRNSDLVIYHLQFEDDIMIFKKSVFDSVFNI